jgi:DNA invertase Pin-like site-specific DNA recombinase
VQEQVLAEIWRLGGQVFSTAQGEAAYLVPDDVEDPSRKLIRQVLGAVAEYERAMIALRMRRGRRRKAESGGYAYGSPPFGAQALDRELVPEENEQQAVARITALRSEGPFPPADRRRPARGGHPAEARQSLASAHCVRSPQPG